VSLTPKLGVLPPAQRALWPELRQLPRGFVLYGGTALALRLGHRQSVDFDFFADAPVDPEALLGGIPLLGGATVRQKSPNTLTVVVKMPDPVKLSFFGLALRRVREPDSTDDGVLRVASLLDVAGCKMASIQSRSEAKDYLDIHAMLQAGLKLPEMLAAAQAVYGAQFFALISLKALTWFNDGDLPGLPAEVKETLRRAAGDVRQIPELQALPGGVSPAEPTP
jgi:hypothetical protein